MMVSILRSALVLILMTLLVCCGPQAGAPTMSDFSDRGDLALDVRKSGYDFLTKETQILQDDDFANPGFLWVDKGRDLFAKQAGEPGKSCASCHGGEGETLIGAAARYPAIDEPSGRLVNIESRINLCRKRYLGLEAIAYESDDLLSLTAYVGYLSRGMPMSVRRDSRAERNFNDGRDYFFRRKGQLNIACNQCHDDNWGRMLRGDTISQGQSNGFPTYRFEWQTLGSLHRRLQDCDIGVRADPMPLGSKTYMNLEYYLASRASGLTVETPSLRR